MVLFNSGGCGFVTSVQSLAKQIRQMDERVSRLADAVRDLKGIYAYLQRSAQGSEEE